jgi:Ran GTPase-activating protein (RanGAP) involved in mRNA processing and transport
VLDNNKITSVGVSVIAKALDGNTTLERLVLSYNDDIGDAGIHFLTQTLSLNSSPLLHLHLTKTGITDKGAECVAEMLKRNSTLRSLTLSMNNIGGGGVELLTNALSHHNSTLDSIDLSWNKLVSDRSVEFLVEMFKQNRSLSFLYISNCNLTEQGEDKLRQITQTKKNFHLFV